MRRPGEAPSHDRADRRGTVLVTGANGYIGGAVARAFSRAGWRTYGLIRRAEDAAWLARDEVLPVIGTPEDHSFLDRIGSVAFDVVVSNTEDMADQSGHLERVRRLLQEIGDRSVKAGVRPLVMFSSGCKDYGVMAEVHGDPGLAAHTETSPLNPPDFLAARTAFGQSLLEQPHTSYDAVVLRPTNVYGHTSSQYGLLFELAAQSTSGFRILGDPRSVMHALHVDDCGEAYVAVAECLQEAVVGQAFNISNAYYETAHVIGTAVAGSYKLGLAFEPPPRDLSLWSAHGLANFSQWVSSEKLRSLTGWHERRPTFSSGVHRYRLAYEATT